MPKTDATQPRLPEKILGGLLEAIKEGGDWDVGAEGRDWSVRPSLAERPEPVVEAVRFDSKGREAEVRRFRIALVEE